MVSKKIEQLILEILRAKLIEIRDVDNGKEPFRYSSGNCGPIYVSLRDVVGRKKIIESLSYLIAEKIRKNIFSADLIAGNATAGIVPGWLVSGYLDLPFVYIRSEKKDYGQKEQIVGMRGNPNVNCGDNALIVDELVNSGFNIMKSARVLRDAGFVVTHAACFMSYASSEVVRNLKKENIKLIHLFTLSQLLEVAKNRNIYSPEVIRSFKKYLKAQEK